jgi:hypothetical protein
VLDACANRAERRQRAETISAQFAPPDHRHSDYPG